MKQFRNRSEGLERILWSIALPGFGQILNKQIIKGVFFIFLEFVINIQANINLAMIDSFYADTESAVKKINYEWFMFYPCIYMFAIWDSYKNTIGDKQDFISLPFVMAAIFSTLGVIYSPSIRVFGFLLGPILLPVLCIAIGIAAGFVIRKLLLANL